jgi:hypothetical protein
LKQLKQKWRDLEYKTKAYILMTLAVAILLSLTFLLPTIATSYTGQGNQTVQQITGREDVLVVRPQLITLFDIGLLDEGHYVINASVMSVVEQFIVAEYLIAEFNSLEALLVRDDVLVHVQDGIVESRITVWRGEIEP